MHHKGLKKYNVYEARLSISPVSNDCGQYTISLNLGY